jgi:hypothetical protein
MYIELELFHLRIGVTKCKCEGRNIERLLICSNYVKLAITTQYFLSEHHKQHGKLNIFNFFNMCKNPIQTNVGKVHESCENK